MTAKLLNGALVAKQLRNQLKQEILRSSAQRPPELAVVLVGSDPASQLYVKKKCRACQKVGMRSLVHQLPENISEKSLLNLIKELNAIPEIDGILIQLPLPKHISTQHVFELIGIDKDVDGFHPYHLGCLGQGQPRLRPCTPYGIIQLLNYYQISLKGKHAVILGASNIVGKPLALEFLIAEATITICHKETRQLEQYIRQADILVSAIGNPNVIKAEWIKDQSIIIDVGINPLPDGSIQGDIPFNLAQEKAAYITPVPGGIGPMTIITLLQNTWTAFQKRMRL